MSICNHCNMDLAVANPSGFCNHVYYPDNCDACSGKKRHIMTPAERAEKIIDDLSLEVGIHPVARRSWKALIANQIAEDVREAEQEAILNDRNKRTADDIYKHSYERGFADAIEKAANEVRSYLFEKGLSVELLDLANTIEAIKPEGTKHKCCSCGELRDDCDYGPDPYASEIYDDKTPVWECPECRSNSAMDV